MAGMKVSELEFIRLLPVFMQDDEAVIALGKAVDKLIRPLGQRVKINRFWDQIDNLNESECDEMAWEFDLDWYDKNYSLDVKRKLIKNSLSAHRITGTKKAVLNVLSSVFENATLEEWFEYGGRPYFFRLKVEIPDEGITARQQDSALYGIEYCKNVRSRLEAIDYYTHSEGEVKIGAYAGTSELIEIWPELIAAAEIGVKTEVGGPVMLNKKIEVFP